jgi:ribonuclease PH
VIQADGGTRCAAINGSFISLVLAFQGLRKKGIIDSIPVSDFVAAISVGMSGKNVILDLSYDEDSTAAVDMNLVMTGKGRFVEIQGTAEREPFDQDDMNKMMSLAKKGIAEIVSRQKEELPKIF